MFTALLQSEAVTALPAKLEKQRETKNKKIKSEKFFIFEKKTFR